MTRNPGPGRIAHQLSTVSTWHPRTPWDTRRGKPSPRSANSMVPKRVSSLCVGNELMRSHARRMSSRYVAIVLLLQGPFRSRRRPYDLTRPELGETHGAKRVSPCSLSSAGREPERTGATLIPPSLRPALPVTIRSDHAGEESDGPERLSSDFSPSAGPGWDPRVPLIPGRSPLRLEGACQDSLTFTWGGETGWAKRCGVPSVPS
jgi:hypothetical protein